VRRQAKKAPRFCSIGRSTQFLRNEGSSDQDLQGGAV